jgi:predicted small lipoprotein YifL
MARTGKSSVAARAVAALGLTMLLAGCGQKGPLVLPPATAASAPAATR